MMILNKDENSSVPSLVFSTVNAGEACFAFLDCQQHMLTMHLEKVVDCPSQKQANFALRLINALSNSKLFEGTAILLEPEYTSNEEKLSHFDEQQLLRHGGSFFSNYRIRYTFSIFCDGNPSDPSTMAVRQGLSKRCQMIHSKMQEFIKKYRIQNRISYWMYHLAEALNTSLPKKDSDPNVQVKGKEQRVDIKLQLADKSQK